MNKYSAISYSKDNYLAHYGVRGMHWGVHKAIETQNVKKLNREYTKAIKKLNKLNALADVDIQRESVKKHNRRAGVSWHRFNRTCGGC